MRQKSGGWALALVCIAASACGGGRQEAAVALDEARLSVSGARRAGAETSAPARLGEALAALTVAEDSFSRKKFGAALASAQSARDSARLAEKTAKAKVAEIPGKKRRKGRK